MPLPQTKIFFPHLDGFRFIAFLAVFINHSFGCLGYINYNHTYGYIRSWYLMSGDLGVNLFFVLSGFLITYLLLKEKEIHGKINIPHFYLRRVLRIWPVYFFVVGLCLFLFPLFANSIPANFPIGVSTKGLNPWFYDTFTGNFDYLYNGISNVLIGVLWSVSIEEQFYLFWPLLVAFIPRRYLLPVFISVILGAVAFRYWGTDGGSNLILKYHSLSCMSDLATGALLALLCCNERFIAAIKKTPRWFIILLYILFIAIVPFRKYTWKLGVHYVLGASLFPVLIACFFAFFILEQNYAQRSFYKMGNSKFISSLGKYTYGMYCYHMIIFFLVLYTFYTCGADVSQPHKYLFIAEMAISLVCTILFSKFSYRYIESNFLKLKNRFAAIVK